jgi:hypothetical protein
LNIPYGRITAARLSSFINPAGAHTAPCKLNPIGCAQHIVDQVNQGRTRPDKADPNGGKVRANLSRLQGFSQKTAAPAMGVGLI